MFRSGVDLWHGRRQRATFPNPPFAKPAAWDANQSGEAINNKYLQAGDTDTNKTQIQIKYK